MKARDSRTSTTGPRAERPYEPGSLADRVRRLYTETEPKPKSYASYCKMVGISHKTLLDIFAHHTAKNSLPLQPPKSAANKQPRIWSRTRTLWVSVILKFCISAGLEFQEACAWLRDAGLGDLKDAAESTWASLRKAQQERLTGEGKAREERVAELEKEAFAAVASMNPLQVGWLDWFPFSMPFESAPYNFAGVLEGNSFGRLYSSLITEALAPTFSRMKFQTVAGAEDLLNASRSGDRHIIGGMFRTAEREKEFDFVAVPGLCAVLASVFIKRPGQRLLDWKEMRLNYKLPSIIVHNPKGASRIDDTIPMGAEAVATMLLERARECQSDEDLVYTVSNALFAAEIYRAFGVLADREGMEPQFVISELGKPVYGINLLWRRRSPIWPRLVESATETAFNHHTELLAETYAATLAMAFREQYVFETYMNTDYKPLFIQCRPAKELDESFVDQMIGRFTLLADQLEPMDNVKYHERVRQATDILESLLRTRPFALRQTNQTVEPG